MLSARRLTRFTGSLVLGLASLASLALAGTGVAGATGYTVSEVTVGANPATVAVDSANHRLYAANQGSDTVSVVDTSTDLVVDTVVVGYAPSGVAIDPSTNLLFVSNLSSASVSVINLADDTVTATIDVGGTPDGIAVDPQLGEVLVADHGNGLLSVIDETTETVVNTVALSGQTYGVSIDTGTHTAYVANATTDQIDVIDEATWTVSTSFSVGDLPVGVLVVPSINRIFVTNYNSQTLSVINETDLSSVALVPLGVAPSGIVVDASETTAYVAQQGGGVAVIDLGDDAVVNQIPVGQQPDGLAIDTTNNVVYAADGGGSEVSVITGLGALVNDDYSYAAGAGSGTAPASGSGLDGTTITLAANSFTYPGHTFAGWNDGTATYSAGSNYTLSSDGAPIVLTAQWTANATDTISFNSEGGNAVSPLSGPDGSTITLPAAPTRTGYVFAGWFTAPTGGSALTSPYTLTGSVTLYAQWTVGPKTSILIPSKGATLSGTSTTLDAAASNATSVEFLLFGGSYGFNPPVVCSATLTSYGWVCSWNTTTVPDGSYTLVSYASGPGGTAASSGVGVKVNNPPPTTSVLVPSKGASLSGSTVLDASASNATSVSFVLFGGSYGYDGQVIGTATLTSYGWIYTWNSTSVPNGNYTLTSLATNSVGSTYSAGIGLTVHN